MGGIRWESLVLEWDIARLCSPVLGFPVYLIYE